MKSQFRQPNKYAELISSKRQKKWDKIITAFMDGRFEELKKIHRTGTRGRIFAVLVKNMFEILQIPHDSEPIFDHIIPNKWYLDFAAKYDLKIRAHEFYNPDYILPDGAWLEVTLSENTAYKKLFRYGHQSPFLKVIWIDEDTGLHKKKCKNIEVPNAQVISIKSYFLELGNIDDGKDLITKFMQLKKLKGIIK